MCFRTLFISLGLAATLQAQQFPINNGILQSDLDANNYSGNNFRNLFAINLKLTGTPPSILQLGPGFASKIWGGDAGGNAQPVSTGPGLTYNVGGTLTLTQPMSSPTNLQNSAGSLILDFNLGNYQFMGGGQSLTITGFQNNNSSAVSWTVFSWSNTTTGPLTFGWPGQARLYGTNGITLGNPSTISVPAGKVVKATFSIETHGTNACVIVQGN